MRLLYGTTTALVVSVSERFYASRYVLYLAENFNTWPRNPPSSNPYQLYLDYAEIVRSQDVRNPKFTAHQRGVRRGIRILLAGGIQRQHALATVNAMGVHGMKPYLAVLERDTYERNNGSLLYPLPPGQAGSPNSVEYRVPNIEGPNAAVPELHLEAMHY